MKSMKGRILKKLKSIPQMGHLKHGRILHLKASDGLFFRSSPLRPPPSPPPPLSDQPEIIDVAELMRDLKDEEDDDKENIKPLSMSAIPWQKKKTHEPKHKKASPFRRPDLNSSTLFDPDLLAAFKQAVKDQISSGEQSKEEEEEEPPAKLPRIDDLLIELEEKCPPGGRGTVIFYTTSLRGIRKTFEDCSAIRFLLESSNVLFYERDVSMHVEFREELQRVLGFRAIPPRLFIDGKYVGGADEVLGFHEQGRLMPMLKAMPAVGSGVAEPACWRCAGVRFFICERCAGGRKMYDDVGGAWEQCSGCNENGLVVCHLCCL